MHKLIIKPFAEEDALEAAIWYNNIKKGLGNEFLLALEAKINSIQRNPAHFQIAHNKDQEGVKGKVSLRYLLYC